MLRARTRLGNQHPRLDDLLNGNLEGVRREKRGRLEGKLDIFPFERCGLILQKVFHQTSMIPPLFGIWKVAHKVARTVDLHALVDLRPFANCALNARDDVVVHGKN